MRVSGFNYENDHHFSTIISEQKVEDNQELIKPKGKWWLLGKTPDYRFTLANERTFLAWIRTSMAMMAGALGIEQFASEHSSPQIRLIISLVLLITAAAIGFLAWRRWRNNEFSMRMEQNLPYSSSVFILGFFIVILSLLLITLVWST